MKSIKILFSTAIAFVIFQLKPDHEFPQWNMGDKPMGEGTFIVYSAPYPNIYMLCYYKHLGWIKHDTFAELKTNPWKHQVYAYMKAPSYMDVNKWYEQQTKDNHK